MTRRITSLEVLGIDISLFFSQVVAINLVCVHIAPFAKRIVAIITRGSSDD